MSCYLLSAFPECAYLLLFHTSNQDTTTNYCTYVFICYILYIRIVCWYCYCWMKERERERESYHICKCMYLVYTKFPYIFLFLNIFNKHSIFLNLYMSFFLVLNLEQVCKWLYIFLHHLYNVCDLFKYTSGFFYSYLYYKAVYRQNWDFF